VRCATLYLVHSVVQAFWVHPTYHKSLLTQSEDTKDWPRTDLTFYKTKKGLPNRTFMILEYKRRTVIKKSEFEHSYNKPRSWPEGATDFDSLNKLILRPLGGPNHSSAVNASKKSLSTTGPKWIAQAFLQPISPNPEGQWTWLNRLRRTQLSTVHAMSRYSITIT
jgi:hypothetical protein